MKKLIKLTEGDLHRIVKESVNRILKEYTNGATERMYNALQPNYNDSPALHARKRAARDYLSDRYARENNLSDSQVDAIARGNYASLYDANLPGTFLKRYDKNTDAARGMAYNIQGRRPKPEPEQPTKKPKKGLFGRFKK